MGEVRPHAPFLAPEIVEQIVDGRQPPELTAQNLLTDRAALPLNWNHKRRRSESPRAFEEAVIFTTENFLY